MTDVTSRVMGLIVVLGVIWGGLGLLLWLPPHSIQENGVHRVKGREHDLRGQAQEAASRDVLLSQGDIHVLEPSSMSKTKSSLRRLLVGLLQARPITGSRRAIRGLPGAQAVWIPPGSFWMGASRAQKWAEAKERPRHHVTISRGFWMMQTEVTQGQYEALMKTNPSIFRKMKLCTDPRCPVELVTWHDALRFANRLSRREGRPTCFICSRHRCRLKARYYGMNARSYTRCRGWRLPTEAEWEYAARAGDVQPRGPLAARAWYAQNAHNHTQPVARKLPNAWGLYDMLGNLFEWTYDGWMRRYSRVAVRDPITHEGVARVGRGGCWNFDARFVRVTFRFRYDADGRNDDVGFRLVRSGP